MDLPVRRTAIYELICQYLLKDWDELGSVQNNFDKDIKEFILEQVALNAHKEGSRVFSRKALESITQEVMESHHAEENSKALIGELVYRSSLLRFSGDQELEFPHLSFQEYFAAKRFLRIPDLNFLKMNLVNGWWRGTWLFYFGLKRSMDELSIRGHRKLKGSGLALMEFLEEADYSSKKTKKAIVGIVGNDLLGRRELSEAEMEACSRLGKNLLEALYSSLETSTVSTDPTIYFKLIFSTNSPGSMAILINSLHFVNRLPTEEIIWLLSKLVFFLHGDKDDRWLQFFHNVYDELDESIRISSFNKNKKEMLYHAIAAIEEEISIQVLNKNIEDSVARTIFGRLKSAKRRLVD